MPDFQFIDPGPLFDGELGLVVVKTSQADPGKAWVPGYDFEMRVGGRQAGGIRLRIGNIMKIVNHCGHIGYEVEPEFRGHNYAERACRLVLPIAKAHGQSPIYITCDPDNTPSRRTIEKLGFTYLGTVPVPLHSELYESGTHRVNRYLMEL